MLGFKLSERFHVPFTSVALSWTLVVVVDRLRGSIAPRPGGYPLSRWCTPVGDKKIESKGVFYDSQIAKTFEKSTLARFQYQSLLYLVKLCKDSRIRWVWVKWSNISKSPPCWLFEIICDCVNYKICVFIHFYTFTLLFCLPWHDIDN